MVTTKRTFALLAALTMAGCSGAGAAGNPIPGFGTAPAPATNAAERARLTVRVRIPKRRRGARRARYISPATKGMTLAFSGASSLTDTVGLTPSSPGCKGSPLECTVELSLRPGSYLLTVRAYDKAPAAHAIPTGANLLSSASNLPVKVAAGTQNHLGLTLDGVPAKLTIGTFAFGTAGTGFLASSFTIGAQDADSDTIVGTYATPVKLSDSDTSGAIAVATSGTDGPPAQTLLGSSDTAALSYSGAPLGAVTIVAAAGNVKASRVFAVTNPIFVADGSGTNLKEIAPDCFLAGCTKTLSPGGYGDIVGLASAANGDLYVADAPSQTIYHYQSCPEGECLVDTPATGVPSLKGLAIDSGAHHVYASSGSYVYEFSPPSCETTSCASNVAQGAFFNPAGVAVDASENLYVADPSLGAVYKVPSGCTSPTCVVALGGTASNTPQGVAVDNAGHVYVADTFGSIFEMPDTCQSQSCATAIGAGFLEPYNVAIDDLGNVNVTDVTANKVYQFVPQCSVESCTFSVGGGFSGPSAVSIP
jgi:hypothetical protein